MFSVDQSYIHEEPNIFFFKIILYEYKKLGHVYLFCIRYSSLKCDHIFQHIQFFVINKMCNKSCNLIN